MLKSPRHITTGIAVAAGIVSCYFLTAPWVDAEKVKRDFAISAIDFGPPPAAVLPDLMLPARWMNHHFRPYWRYCRLALGEPIIVEF